MKIRIKSSEIPDHLKKFFKPVPGLKPKDLVGIPWRLAFALQADGWYLRSDIIWQKPNPMPESVTDRPTKSHEYLFLLSKREHYYFDADAVREPGLDYGSAENYRKRVGKARYHEGNSDPGGGGFRGEGGFADSWNPAGRNIRTVWSIPTESYPGSHFATYPRKLVEPCIRAGTSEKGCCPVCGAGWVRVTEDSPEYAAIKNGRRGTKGYESRGLEAGNRFGSETGGLSKSVITIGWRPACSHDAAPVPAVVLDPFVGSGTSIVVANALGRHGIGLDLSREYLGLAQRRIARPHAPVPRPTKEEYHPLFGDSA